MTKTFTFRKGGPKGEIIDQFEVSEKNEFLLIRERKPEFKKNVFIK